MLVASIKGGGEGSEDSGQAEEAEELQSLSRVLLRSETTSKGRACGGWDQFPFTHQ
jgi:hypothetical protein